MIKNANREIPLKHQKIIDILSLIMKKPKKKNIQLKDNMKILIVYPRRIGDCVMAIPFLRNIRNEYVINITIIGPKYFKEFLNGQNLYDEYIDFGKSAGPVSGSEWLHNLIDIHKALIKARRVRYDIAIEPFGECFASIFMRLCRANNYVGIGIDNLSKLLSYCSDYDDDAHITTNMLNMYYQLGGNRNEELNYPIILPTSKWGKRKNRLLKEWDLDGKYILGIHCGASTKLKKWMGFSALVKLIIERKKNIFFVFFEVKEDEEYIQQIIEENKLTAKEYTIVDQKLRDYIDTLRICDYIVCNDSSCGHLAAAQGVDVTVLYGPYLPVMGTPLGKANVTLISKNLPCKPCSYFSCEFGDDIRCLNEISAEEVFDTIPFRKGTIEE